MLESSLKRIVLRCLLSRSDRERRQHRRVLTRLLEELARWRRGVFAFAERGRVLDRRLRRRLEVERLLSGMQRGTFIVSITKQVENILIWPTLSASR